MSQNNNYFYLKKVYPDPFETIKSSFKSLDDIKDNCIFILDTNILLFPYKISPSSFEEFQKLYDFLIKENRLIIPGRVLREFTKNRGKNLSEIFKYLSQQKNNLNKKKIDFKLPSILEGESDFQKIIDLKKSLNSSIHEIKESLDKLEKKVLSYNWDDPVSLMYQKLFKQAIIKEVTKKEGINRAFTFKGFCNKHDTEIFSYVETGEIDFSEYRSCLLLSYRALVNVVLQQKTGQKKLSSVFKIVS